MSRGSATPVGGGGGADYSGTLQVNKMYCYVDEHSKNQEMIIPERENLGGLRAWRDWYD